MNKLQLNLILQEVKQALQKLYQNQLEAIILYGSQAREDAKEFSDIDILVVIVDFLRKIKIFIQQYALFKIQKPTSVGRTIALSIIAIQDVKHGIGPRRTFYYGILILYTSRHCFERHGYAIYRSAEWDHRQKS